MLRSIDIALKRCRIIWFAKTTMTNKLSLNDAIKIAESREGKCLSKEYINSETPMLWECNKNHRWTAQFRSIKNRHSWCPHCANKKLSIAVAEELAHALLHMLKTRVLGVANVRNLGLNLLKILHIEKEVFVFLILTAINVVNYLGVVLKGIHGLPKLAI
jgi:hypothetical protein